MYAVDHFAQTDSKVLRAYLTEHPFATLFVATPEGPSADHLPMEFDPSFGSQGRLVGHVARANPLWRHFTSAPESAPGPISVSTPASTTPTALAVFSAHHAYVSPDWYASKRADPRVVPTWNYAAVHVSGRLSFFHDAERIGELLARLTERFESPRPSPWQLTDAPDEFIEKMISGVVGFELEIESLVGKWKLSQNRSQSDQEGVREGLRREGGVAGKAIADLMEPVSS
jgi:transcriptional regulator